MPFPPPSLRWDLGSWVYHCWSLLRVNSGLRSGFSMLRGCLGGIFFYLVCVCVLFMFTPPHPIHRRVRKSGFGFESSSIGAFFCLFIICACVYFFYFYFSLHILSSPQYGVPWPWLQQSLGVCGRVCGIKYNVVIRKGRKATHAINAMIHWLRVVSFVHMCFFLFCIISPTRFV